ncbi:hypothetical protein KUTeg_003224 [Tegillarca granosa]|uniref:Neurotransmitter-gated ion-channel ligand-binding domain-containing protein n=1 Tax=Tegillarca granosa TaxID=220873 RepID=A0ABQ9FQZ6_TEGGR|nr:hypothetical protein KUTeg_003224 [Tegillarca granosa]
MNEIKKQPHLRKGNKSSLAPLRKGNKSFLSTYTNSPLKQVYVICLFLVHKFIKETAYWSDSTKLIFFLLGHSLSLDTDRPRVRFGFAMLLQCWILVIQVCYVAGVWSSGDEKFIRETIFSKTNYDYLTRPMEVTNVSVALNLLAINTLHPLDTSTDLKDIKTQHLSCTGWLSMEWIDSRLTWNMTSGTESKYVFAKNKEIWFPEIFVDNSLADVNVINNDDLLYKVRFDGSVVWEIPRIFTTYCEVDITYFPFDTQTCTIELTSWAYNTNQVILNHFHDHINTEDFK